VSPVVIKAELNHIPDFDIEVTLAIQFMGVALLELFALNQLPDSLDLLQLYLGILFIPGVPIQLVKELILDQLKDKLILSVFLLDVEFEDPESYILYN